MDEVFENIFWAMKTSLCGRYAARDNGMAAIRYKIRFGSVKYSESVNKDAAKNINGTAKYAATTNFSHKQLSLPKKPGVSKFNKSSKDSQPFKKICPIGILSEIESLFILNSPKKTIGV